MKLFNFIVLIIINTSVVYGQKNNWINFEWSGDSISGRYFEKSSIIVPIQIDNLPYKFSAQLDLGAVNTMLYGNSIEPYLNQHNSLKSKIDTNAIIWVQSQKNPTIKNVNLKIDNTIFNKIDIALFKNYGDSLTFDSIKSNTIKHIGTIAPDIFQNKIVIIDYPNHRLCALDRLPIDLEKQCSFTNFIINEGRIKIPFNINGKVKNLLFDTGSSLFSIYTSQKNMNDISNPNSPICDSLKISSWGEYYFAYGKKIEVDIKFVNKILPAKIAFFDKKDDFDVFLDNEKIWGITGNDYFVDNILVIDYKNKRIGLK